MTSFVIRSLEAFNFEKNFKVENWSIVEKLLVLFDILEKLPMEI